MIEATTHTEAAPPAPKSATASFVPRQRRIVDLTTVTAISFSLTFVGASLLLLAGVLPTSLASLAAPVDIGVLLLIVPLCALVLAMMAEVIRAAVKGTPPRRAARHRTRLSEWRPEHSEG